MAGFGEGTPQQDSRRGKNERKANFGTSVESCSKKLPDCRLLPTATFPGNRNQFFHKELPDCPHLLLPLLVEIYNQLFFTHRALGWLRFARRMKKSAAFFRLHSLIRSILKFAKRTTKKQQIFFRLTAHVSLRGGGYSVVK